MKSNDGIDKAESCLARNLILAINDAHEFYLNQNALANALSKRTTEAIKTFLSQPPGEILEQSVAFFTEFFITGKAFNATAIKFGESLKIAKEFGQYFKAEAMQVATTALNSEKTKLIFGSIASVAERGVKTAVKACKYTCPETRAAFILVEEVFGGTKSSLSRIKNAGKIFETGIEQFETTKGFKENIIDRIKSFQSCETNEKIAGMKGALYEIEAGLQLEAEGEKVIEFGLKDGFKNKLGEINTIVDFDIVTKTKLIECKNLNWSKKSCSKLRESFGYKNKIAKQHGKVLELRSKTPIPNEVKEWCNERNIKFMEK